MCKIQQLIIFATFIIYIQLNWSHRGHLFWHFSLSVLRCPLMKVTLSTGGADDQMYVILTSSSSNWGHLRNWTPEPRCSPREARSFPGQLLLVRSCFSVCVYACSSHIYRYVCLPNAPLTLWQTQAMCLGGGQLLIRQNTGLSLWGKCCLHWLDDLLTMVSFSHYTSKISWSHTESFFSFSLFCKLSTWSTTAKINLTIHFTFR